MLRGLVGPDWFIMEEKYASLGRHWIPKPDAVAIRGALNQYRERMPESKDSGLIVEVSEATYATDRGLKWRRYAAVGIPVYWIVNIPKRLVEVYGSPSGRGKTAKYRDVVTFGEDEEVPVVIDGREVGRVVVKDILP